MKILVVLVVHNRLQNLRRWLECWSQCEKDTAKFIVVHNGTESDRPRYQSICRSAGVEYILRENIGMDIGAFQDVCRERITGFDYDYGALIWCVDDWMPMQPDFVQQYRNLILQDGVGMVASHISTEVRTHCQTSGFCITKETSQKIQFPADPILTKDHCYEFEHRSDNYFYKQITDMGKSVFQISPIETGPFWDSGRPAGSYGYVDRKSEHYDIFPKVAESKVLVISPAYQRYPQIIPSLICQTHQNWELYLEHDGENYHGLREVVASFKDSRIHYSESQQHEGEYGHPIRIRLLKKMQAGEIGTDAKYVLVTNEDNYHVPLYLERLVMELDRHKRFVGAYCSQMVHNYGGYVLLPASRPVTRGTIDCASPIFRKEVLMRLGWPIREQAEKTADWHSSDWTYIKNVIDCYGEDRLARVNFVGLVHN